jgi:hypothetical protein
MATCNAFAPRPSAMPARRRPPPAGPHSGRSNPRGTVSLVRRHGRRSPRWTGGSTEPGTSVSTWGLTAREDRSLRPQITPEGTCLPLTALLLRSRGPVRVPSTGEGRRAGHRDGLDAADRAAVSRHTRRRASRRDWCRLPAYGPPVGRMCPERHSPREAGASLGVSCRDRCRFDGHRVSGDHAAKAALLVKASSYSTGVSLPSAHCRRGRRRRVRSRRRPPRADRPGCVSGGGPGRCSAAALARTPSQRCRGPRRPAPSTPRPGGGQDGLEGPDLRAAVRVDHHDARRLPPGRP